MKISSEAGNWNQDPFAFAIQHNNCEHEKGFSLLCDQLDLLFHKNVNDEC